MNSREALAEAAEVLQARAASAELANFRDGLTFSLIRSTSDREAGLLTMLQAVTEEKAELYLELQEAYRLIGRLSVDAARGSLGPPRALEARGLPPDTPRCARCRRIRAGCRCDGGKTCGRCGEEFPDAAGLSRHLREAPGCDHVCAICGYRFTHRENFDRHWAEWHTGDGPPPLG